MATIFNYIHAYKRKAIHKLTDQVSLYSSKHLKNKGRVLISYTSEPFLLTPSETLSTRHSNYWECQEIAQLFLEAGYNVDVIAANNTTWLPKKSYSYVLDVHQNLERLIPYLSTDCKKIAHITTSYWKFQNEAELKRFQDLRKRTGVELKPHRQLPPSRSVELADFISILGNQVTIDTYNSIPHKTMFSISGSNTVHFPFQENKNIDTAKKNFLWLGGGGAIHKGLDLLLECFKKLPEYHLHVCGPVEEDVKNLYYKELFESKNITFYGRIDISGDIFKKIIKNSIALLYPTCSEGQSGSVINCLHAGLIPIVSRNCGVDIQDFCVVLETCSIQEIINVIQKIANTPNSELFSKTKKTWDYAVTHHTKEIFRKNYKEFLLGHVGI